MDNYEFCIKCGEDKVRIVRTEKDHYVKRCFSCNDHFLEKKESSKKKSFIKRFFDRRNV